MRIFRPSKRHLTWSLEFRDHRGAVRVASSHLRQRSAAQICARNVDDLVSARRNAVAPEARLAVWLDAAHHRLREQLLEWGIVDQAWYGVAGLLGVPLVEWVQALGHARELSGGAGGCLVGRWAAALRASGCTEKHAAESAAAAAAVFGEVGTNRFGDIDVEAVARVLAGWRAGPRRMSIRQSNKHAQAVRQCAKWVAEQAGRANPLPRSRLPNLQEATDPRRERRALSVAEALWLIAGIAKLPAGLRGGDGGMDGTTRGLAYHVAIATGLRANELRTRRVVDFVLGGNPYVIIGARDAKNRKAASIDLAADLALALAAEFSRRGLGPADRAFPLPRRTAEMLARDLAAAREAWYQDAAAVSLVPESERADFLQAKNALGEVVDFHSLRHTRGVWLSEVYRLSPRQIQIAMRLSSLALVERYTRSVRLEAGWAERGPSLAVSGQRSEVRAEKSLEGDCV